MATSKTAAEIKAHLKAAIERSPACRGTRYDITVHRMQAVKSARTTAWYADVRRIIGKPEIAEACEDALKDIIARAQEEIELVLDE